MSGLRVELEIDGPPGCSDVELTDGTESTTASGRRPDAGDRATAPFAVDCTEFDATGAPVVETGAEDGVLRVTLAPDDGTDTGPPLAGGRETTEDVTVRGVARLAPAADGPEELVPVDRGRLTDRQLDVLRTAHAMGYYDYPRGANASEVADALGICPSTLAEHLAAAQTKLLGDVLGRRE